MTPTMFLLIGKKAKEKENNEEAIAN